MLHAKPALKYFSVPKIASPEARNNLLRKPSQTYSASLPTRIPNPSRGFEVPDWDFGGAAKKNNVLLRKPSGKYFSVPKIASPEAINNLFRKPSQTYSASLPTRIPNPSRGFEVPDWDFGGEAKTQNVIKNTFRKIV